MFLPRLHAIISATDTGCGTFLLKEKRWLDPRAWNPTKTRPKNPVILLRQGQCSTSAEPQNKNRPDDVALLPGAKCNFERFELYIVNLRIISSCTCKHQILHRIGQWKGSSLGESRLRNLRSRPLQLNASLSPWLIFTEATHKENMKSVQVEIICHMPSTWALIWLFFFTPAPRLAEVDRKQGKSQSLLPSESWHRQ